ncbi:MAG: winged helix-turn-helix transcriptional regulator [Myxococcales bacterium]|nr:winged helix-turn-helix transcriptional regulator [Myxococcales bacterium]
MTLHVIRAMACPVRAAIYGRLGSEGRRVGEVAAEVGVAQSTASYHIRTLREAGLVEPWCRRYRWTQRRWFLVEARPGDEVWVGHKGSSGGSGSSAK